MEDAARVYKGALEIEANLSGAYLRDKKGKDEGVKCSEMAGRLENTMHMDVTVEPDGTEAVTLSR